MHIPQTEVVVRHEGAELARVTLPPGEYVIGRSPDVDICADTPLISWQHARLTIHQDHLLLEDLGSSNGTFVNDLPIAEVTRVQPHQPVRLGDVQIEIIIRRALSTHSGKRPPPTVSTRRFLPDGLFVEQRYAIGDMVAQGGMGTILDARQNVIDRTVAMKVMLETADQTDALRFIDEAKITGKLDHPNIVPIYELGIDEQDRLFYTMKMVRGITLQKVLELMGHGVEATMKKYPLPTLLTIFQKVCDAVAFAHSRGVLHRDLKPANIMLGDFGSVLVMDWGLAKVIATEPAPAGFGRTIITKAQTTGLTEVGMIMGTPDYMSPEQARGETELLDQRSDIYSLGAILFEIVHLRPAVTGKGVTEIVAKVARGEVEWNDPVVGQDSARDRRALRTARIPDSLLAICRQALALEPAQRYANVEDLQRDLTAYQSGFAPSAEKAGRAKQLQLLILRHKAASAAIGLLVFVLPIFTLSLLFQVRRAEHEAASARAARANLKRTAPPLLGLAESEARLQHFDIALSRIADALAIDPDLRLAYWRRAWILLGEGQFAEAARAIRIAQDKDPGPKDFGPILPLVEELAAAPADQRWTGDRSARLIKHLESVQASGEVVAISNQLKLGAADKLRLVKSRVKEWLGGDSSNRVKADSVGIIEVSLIDSGIDTLERLRGLPIDSLRAVATNVSELEPLRGMKLSSLEIFGTKVADLAPVQGMPLRKLSVGNTRVKSLAPLKSAPLEDLNCSGLHLADFSPLAAAPLTKADISDNEAANLTFLARAPIEDLSATRNLISDLTPLRGKLLRRLTISSNRIGDLSPLKGAPLEVLEINSNPIKDLAPALELPKLEKIRVPNLGKGLEPLRHHPTLKMIAIEGEGYRPVAEFWAEYDAAKKPGGK